ncbi:DUF3492 domain-containing protein [Streptomyces johnsoniae]|uniref:D-inositol 3-phosphate glycosyltransferase n=1 Tax=Streptomyces johnsoniae TaxID=3075532 RepID=A0ABU2S5R9_9ACTN|nr:DUF3492 domain-containing protein [Streptomyces sp. DSM 41886]MDT0443189.1 DUF3492 domain-containing protein [Streptomyces sp. DSM 41886]
MRVALLTEGGYPYAQGESVAWCDRLLHGLPEHDFEVLALSRGRQQELGPRRPLPANVRGVHTAPLWGPPQGIAARPGAPRAWARVARAPARRFAECFAELVAALCPGYQPLGEAQPARQADRFADGLYGLADLAAHHGGLSTWLYSEHAVRALEAACRAPGAPRAVHGARVADLLAVAERLERALRPLSLGWYEAEGPGAGELCHAVGAGPAALAGLIARHRYGTPLLITEYGVRLREHYLASAAAHTVPRSAAGAPVRALLAAFQVRLAREAYRRAALITPGDTTARRWQERCGAEPARLRTVYPGLDARPFRAAAEAGSGRGAAFPALVWVGRAEPGKGLAGLLHAFHAVRAAEPAARLRIVGTPARGRPDAGYLARCRALAARLFPGPAGPVTFTEVGGADVPTLADAYAAGGVVVFPGADSGFPLPLIEAMFCARATVATDAGAVAEVVGGAGLVVPPGDRRALADACLALLRDPARRARLGAAARARALDLFTVERNVAAFDAIYRELGRTARSAAGLATEPIPAAGRPGERV